MDFKIIYVTCIHGQHISLGLGFLGGLEAQKRAGDGKELNRTGESKGVETDG